MDFAEHVPAQLRDRFVTAYRGQYGWWFEFDGSVRFDDARGGGGNSLLPTASRLTIAGQ